MLDFLPEVNFEFLNNVNTTMYMIGFICFVMVLTIIGVLIKLFTDNAELKEKNEKLQKDLNDSERTFILGDSLVRKQRERLKHYDDLLAFHSKLTTESRNVLELQQAEIEKLAGAIEGAGNVDKLQVNRIKSLEAQLEVVVNKLNATQSQLDLALETIENAGVKPDVENEDKP